MKRDALVLLSLVLLLALVIAWRVAPLVTLEQGTALAGVIIQALVGFGAIGAALAWRTAFVGRRKAEAIAEMMKRWARARIDARDEELNPVERLLWTDREWQEAKENAPLDQRTLSVWEKEIKERTTDLQILVLLAQGEL